MAKTSSKKGKSETRLRIGIIGAGMYAAVAHVPAIHRFQGVSIVAACRKDPDRLKKFCQVYKIPHGYTDYREMLRKEELDGVIIASPNNLHYEHAMACLKHKIPVMLEKPMCIKASDALELHKYAEKEHIPVVVGFNRHYWANFCYAKKMIEDEQLGIIQNINVRWLADIEWALARQEPPESFQQKAFYAGGDEPNFRGDPEQAGGGMFIDGGSHMLDCLFWLTNLKPVEIYAKMENRGFMTDCDTSLTLELQNNTLCSCTVLGAAKTFKGHQIFIYGSKGSVYVDDFTIFYQLNGEKEVQVVDLPADSCSTANFVHVLQNKDKIHCSTRDGARTVIAVEAAYKSAKEGKPVQIKGWIS